MGTLALSTAAFQAAALYGEAVERRQWRIQAGLNAEACVDTAKLLVAKDTFLVGEVQIDDLGCVAQIQAKGMHRSIRTAAQFGGVGREAFGEIDIPISSI